MTKPKAVCAAASGIGAVGRVLVLYGFGWLIRMILAHFGFLLPEFPVWLGIIVLIIGVYYSCKVLRDTYRRLYGACRGEIPHE